MSALKATPGPWKFVPWHIAESASEVRAPDGWLVCCTSSDANARLIAAAPALYEALDRMASFLVAPADEIDSPNWLEEARERVRVGELALKQARGDLVDPLEQVRL